MDKRIFLKLLSAAIAGPVVAPLLARVPNSKLTNWAGNLEYGTENLYAATSSEQVVEFVKKQPRFKVLGTRHSFNDIANSKNYFLSLKPMSSVVALDAQAHTVTVDGAITYGQLAPELHAKGFALHNLASLPHISVAGSCSTATHGSGQKNGNLATAVSALELVTAGGDLVKLSRHEDGDAFLGAVTAGLSMLIGIVAVMASILAFKAF